VNRAQPTSLLLSLNIHKTLKTELTAWQQEGNQEHAKIKWQFTTADARIKLHHLYPQF
jgi:hypothetical protein